MERKKVVFTGGGTAGHVIPNIAIIEELDQEKIECFYIGSKKGIEVELIKGIGISYYPISSGKLRRYIDVENFKDLFRTTKGFFNARKVLKKIRPDLIFSKGGFVTVPVILAARSLRIPCLIHESDITLGLANKIAIPFATKVYTSFPETANKLAKNNAVAIGSPIRKEVLCGQRERGLSLLKFYDNKPILLIMGGSLGSKKINETVQGGLPLLLEKFQIVHLCGKGNLVEKFSNTHGYIQFEFVQDELTHIMAASDFIITRGGSNAIFEFAALKKPMLIIPLPKGQSRGDQILNAKSFVQQKIARMLGEENLTSKGLLEELEILQEDEGILKDKMEEVINKNALGVIVEEINEHLNL